MGRESRHSEELVRGDDERPYLPLGIALDSPRTQYRENFVHVIGPNSLVISSSDTSVLSLDPDRVAESLIQDVALDDNSLFMEHVVGATNREALTSTRGNIQSLGVQAVSLKYYQPNGMYVTALGQNRTQIQPLTWNEARDAPNIRTSDGSVKDPVLAAQVRQIEHFCKTFADARFMAPNAAGRLEEIDMQAIFEYLQSDGFRGMVESGRDYEIYGNEFKYYNAVLMALGNNLHGRSMQLLGIPGLTRLHDPNGGEPPERFATLDSEAAHIYIPGGGLTRPTRDPMHAIDVANTAAFLKDRRNPQYPYPAEMLAELAEAMNEAYAKRARVALQAGRTAAYEAGEAMAEHLVENGSLGDAIDYPTSGMEQAS